MSSPTPDRRPRHKYSWSNIQRLVFKRQRNSDTNAGNHVSTSMEEGLLRSSDADDLNEPSEPNYILGNDDSDESDYGEDLTEGNLQRAGLGTRDSGAARDSMDAIPTVATVATEPASSIEMTTSRRGGRRNRSSRARSANMTPEERAEYARLRHARVRETTRGHAKRCVKMCTSVGDCWDGCGECCLEKCQVCCWSVGTCLEDLGYECDPVKAGKTCRAIILTIVLLLVLTGMGLGIWKLVDLTRHQSVNNNAAMTGVLGNATASASK